VLVHNLLVDSSCVRFRFDLIKNEILINKSILDWEHIQIRSSLWHTCPFNSYNIFSIMCFNTIDSIIFFIFNKQFISIFSDKERNSIVFEWIIIDFLLYYNKYSNILNLQWIEEMLITFFRDIYSSVKHLLFYQMPLNERNESIYLIYIFCFTFSMFSSQTEYYWKPFNNFAGKLKLTANVEF